MLVLFFGGANFTFYHAFMVGSYTFRARELLRMKRVPLAAKIFVSSAASFAMARSLWLNKIYDPDLYKLAIKNMNLNDDVE